MPEALGPTPTEIHTSTASLCGWYGAAGVFLAVLLVVPIWAVEYPPLVDYPNYLARGYILHHYDEIPSFQAQYEIDYLSTPSLAIDLSLLALQPIFDVRTAGKIFLTVTLWLWFLGWHVLGCAIHGRPTWMALGAALFAYHSMFFYGFANFSFSLGVLVSLAVWLHGRSHWPWPRHLLMGALALACYFSHLSAFIFLAGSAMAITVWEGLHARKISRAAVIDIVLLLVPALFFFRGGGQRGFDWNTLQGKLIGALSLLRGYDYFIDVGFITAVSVLFALIYLWSVRKCAVGSILFTGVGCVAMFLIAPHELFGGTPADARFLLPAAALLVLSLDLSFSRGQALIVLGFFLTLVVFRIGMIGYFWHEIDANLGSEIALVDEIPEGARVYPIAQISNRPDEQKRDVPAFHVACYAVIERRAYVPHILAIPGHTPIRYKTPPIMHNARADRPVAPSEVDWDKVFANFDYLWCHRVSGDLRRFLEERCVLVDERGHGTLWRVRKAR